MKKRALLFFLIMTAAIAAAFAFAGCKKSTHVTTDEYVAVWDDSGRVYRIYGGEKVVAFYGCDHENQLNIYYEKCDADNGSVIWEKRGLYSGDGNKPQVYERSFDIKRNGEYETGTVKIIISSQTLIGHIEDDGKGIEGRVYADVGATYTFKPLLSGRYTVNCEPQEESFDGELDYGFYNEYGLWLDKSSELTERREVFINVGVNSDSTFADVDIRVQFTPDVLNLGDNAVTLDRTNYFEFTPKESGIYGVSDDAGKPILGYRFLDGETYEPITLFRRENETSLYAGKKYFIECVGFEDPTEATLTVKIADGTLTLGEETECEWNKHYLFTVPDMCYYTVNVVRLEYSEEEELSIYSECGGGVSHKHFRYSCEHSVLLEAGNYYLNVNVNSKVTCTRTPKIWSDEGRLYLDERSTFVAPFNCKYDFATRDTGAQVKVLDKDGNDVTDCKLTAGEEYTAYADSNGLYGDNNLMDDIFTATPRHVGELRQNVTVKGVAIGEPYLFVPERRGRYKFKGATELAVYARANPQETRGDTAVLEKGLEYYIVLGADGQVYGDNITVKFYPQALPPDGLTKASASELYFSLRSDSVITVNVEHVVNIEYSLFDIDFNEIKAGKFESQTIDTDQIYAELPSGEYYLIFSKCPREVYFDSPVSGSGNVFTVQKGDIFTCANATTYRYECGLGKNELVLNLFDRTLIEYPIKNEINCYYMDGGTEKRLQIESIEMFHDIWIIKFWAKPEADEYFLEFGSDGYEFAFELYDKNPYK